MWTTCWGFARRYVQVTERDFLQFRGKQHVHWMKAVLQ